MSSIRRGPFYQEPGTAVVHYAFRSPGGFARRPIKGGRWEVRKARRHQYSRIGQWQAMSKGKSGALNAWFPTQADAIAWAQIACWAWSTNNAHTLDVLKQVRKYWARDGMTEETLRMGMEALTRHAKTAKIDSTINHL